jgi:glycosyltransferase involved in cell wall biosynthesis
MRIAFVTPEFDPACAGGLANYLFRLSRHLTDLGHVVHVVVSGQRHTDYDFDGVHIHEVGAGRLADVIRRVSFGLLAETGHWLDFAVKARTILRRLHADAGLDIVQFANSRACGLVSTMLVMPMPCVTRLSCYRPLWNRLAGHRRTLDARLLEVLEWLQVSCCRHVYAPSKALASLVSRRVLGKRITIIRTPFYLETTDFDESVASTLREAPYLLFFGKLERLKGFGTLAEALPAFLAACPDARAVIVGADKPAHLGPSMRASALGLLGSLAARVQFRDPLPHTSLYPIIRGARLVCLPSLADNLPNTLLESMGLGKPVIGTIGSSMDEVIEEKRTGFLVPPADSKALAETLIACWRRPDLSAIGDAAREAMQQFAPAVTVSKLLAYFDRLVQPCDDAGRPMPDPPAQASSYEQA